MKITKKELEFFAVGFGIGIGSWMINNFIFSYLELDAGSPMALLMGIGIIVSVLYLFKVKK